jgi:hypothetical protein
MKKNDADAADSYYRARISDLEIDIMRAQKTISEQRRAIEILSDHIASLQQEPSTSNGIVPMPRTFDLRGLRKILHK